MSRLFSKSTFKTALSCPWKLNYLNSDKFDNSSADDPFLAALAEGGFQVGELAKVYEDVPSKYDLDKPENLGADFLKRQAEAEEAGKGPLIPTNQDYLDRTKELLDSHDKINIAEAAFQWDHFFVRADILKKDGRKIELIEVKAKSFDSTQDKPLVKDSQATYAGYHKVNSDLKHYIYDVAFQKYVITRALPDYEVHAYLMMADKSRKADVDHLNQLFKIEHDYAVRFGEERKMSQAHIMPEAPAILAAAKVKVLSRMDVDEACDMIISGQTTEQVGNAALYSQQAQDAKNAADYAEKMTRYTEGRAAGNNRLREPKKPAPAPLPPSAYNSWMDNRTFEAFVSYASSRYCAGLPYSADAVLSGECFGCEFTSDTPERCGKRQCWLRYTSPDKFESEPLIERLNGAALGAKRSTWIEEGKFYMSELTPDDLPTYLAPDPKKGRANHSSDADLTGGLDHYQRKWLQIALETGKVKDLPRAIADCITHHTYLDVEGLRKEMAAWTYPLHMIDFETTAVALPFYKGMKPYEQVAFQFSHHIIRKKDDGSFEIEHAGQYLNEHVEEFPNFHFVRELKRQLCNDEGTVFRYATHENSILRAIAGQLEASSEHDKDVLIEFIRSITHNDDSKNGPVYKGPRDMVDLLEVVKHYFYQLDEMHGSNSIKQVLPAVLNSSKFLQEKYSKAIYGTDIKSCNFSADEPKAWIVRDEKGNVESPYHLLDSVGELIGLTDAQIAELERKEQDDEEFLVANGGAALTAYSKLMFTEGGSDMNEALRLALLRYCELDTMSMVFIWEYFQHSLK